MLAEKTERTRRFRKELKQFAGRTVRITGKVKAFGSTKNPLKRKPTILIADAVVHYKDKKVWVDHLWVVLRRMPNTLDIAVGDIITFEADVVKYRVLPEFKSKDDILRPRYNYGVVNPKNFAILQRTRTDSITLYDAYAHVW